MATCKGFQGAVARLAQSHTARRLEHGRSDGINVAVR
jgi:hypothetical protein